MRPVGLSMDHAIEAFAGAVPGLDTRYRRMATGRPESSGSCGMKGENASSETRTGRVESVKSMRASGNSPVNRAEARRVRPGALRVPRPLDPSYGGWMRDSSTRATALRFPACAQIAGKAYDGELPLSGRLKIS